MDTPMEVLGCSMTCLGGQHLRRSKEQCFSWQYLERILLDRKERGPSEAAFTYEATSPQELLVIVVVRRQPRLHPTVTAARGNVALDDSSC